MGEALRSEHDVLEDASRPELIDGLNARKFDTVLLKNPDITDEGEWVETDEGPGQLVRIPLLEGISWNIPINLVLRNPKQPREYFDEGKMTELEKTIGHGGQEEDIHVIPIKLKATGEIKLFILDGERRYRVMKDRLAFENIKVKIRYVNNFWELFSKSFMVNESRAPQNPIERARVYQFLLDNPHPELKRRVTVVELADILGTDPNDIYLHLRLLTDLDESIQRLIITDKLPRTNALQLASVARNLGDRLPQAKLARRLLKILHGDEQVTHKDTQPGEVQRLTQETVLQAARDLLIEEGEEDAAKQLRAEAAVTRITKSTGRAIHGATEITESDPRLVIRGFRERATPPEAIADEMRRAIAEMSAALAIVEAATKPPPSPEIADKPTFTEYIEEHIDTFETTRRQRLVSLLAKHADGDQRPLTSQEIGKIIKLDTQTVAGNYRHLIPELKAIGLKLEKLLVRQLDKHDNYKKVPAFRLAWILEEKEETLLTDIARDKAAKNAAREAERTRKRVLKALGATRRSTKESPVTEPVNVPPLPDAEGKLPYRDHIIEHQTTFHKNRLPIILVLAQEADATGQPLSAAAIASRIKGGNSITIANNMRFLRKDLAKLGIEIQEFTFLLQNAAGENVKVTHYRIAWIAKTKAAAPTEKATAPKPKPEEEPEPEGDEEPEPADEKEPDPADDEEPDPEPESAKTKYDTLLTHIRAHRDIFETDLQFEIAGIIAELLMDGEPPAPASDIGDYIDESSNMIGRQMPRLRELLETIGIHLIMHGTTPRTYSVEWIEEEAEQPAAPAAKPKPAHVPKPKSAPVPTATPAATPAAKAKPAPAPAPTPASEPKLEIKPGQITTLENLDKLQGKIVYVQVTETSRTVIHKDALPPEVEDGTFVPFRVGKSVVSTHETTITPTGECKIQVSTVITDDAKVARLCLFAKPPKAKKKAKSVPENPPAKPDPFASIGESIFGTRSEVNEAISRALLDRMDSGTIREKDLRALKLNLKKARTSSGALSRQIEAYCTKLTAAAKRANKGIIPIKITTQLLGGV